MNKQIANVVFYKFYGERGEMQQAAVFYTDGTVKNVSHEEGLEAAYEIAKREKIKTKAEFANIINKKLIYTISGKELEKRFKEFLGTGTIVKPKAQVEPVVKSPGKKKEPKAETTTPDIPISKPKNKTNASNGNKKQGTFPIITDPPKTSKPDAKSSKKQKKKKKSIKERIKDKINKFKKNNFNKTNKKHKKNKKAGKAKGLFSKLWAKVTAVVLAVITAFTGGYFLGKNTKSEPITSSRTISQSAKDMQDAEYSNLLEKTKNQEQKATMQHQGQSLDIFNRDFANAYIEEGKKVKAALTWDEMIALNLAYNTYSKDQIKAMFNGAEVDSTAMSNAYKNANLQLMGAYVISTRENPVNSSKFLINKEQQIFVEKYNDLFLKCKETTGEKQIAAINAFYAELYKDFPISNQAREEGISHSTSRSQVELYKTAVIPIVAATEIMFQNRGDIDHTLSDKAIAYFNDIGLCNLVDEQFERVETITLTAETDEKAPLYGDYRKVKIGELVYEDNYPISDERRDLSQLAEFQRWVNGHFEIVNGINTGKVIENTSTSTSEKTSTSTQSNTIITDSRSEAISQAGENAVKDAEAAVNEEIAKQNAASQQAGETEATKKQEQIQAQENKNAATLEEEVAEDNRELENMINNANNGNGTINSENFGDHGVEFDDNHSDNNGNLNNSVGNITTDGTGAVDSSEPLPDPNQDEINATVPSYENTSGQEIYEYDEPARVLTNEEIVDGYIKSLEGIGSEDNPKILVK